MKWKVTAEPHGDNPGTVAEGDEPENMSGLIIYIENDDGWRAEVSRVGYIRRATKNPDTSFQAQLDKEMSRAHQAVNALNALEPNEGPQ